MNDYAVTDHAAAAAEILERYAKRLRSGDDPREVARELSPVLRLMNPKT